MGLEVATLRYHGDVRDAIPAVLGGRWLVIDSSYDADKDETVVEVKPLRDPLGQAIDLRDADQ